MKLTPNTVTTHTLKRKTMLEGLKANVVAAKEAKQLGFANYNDYNHLVVEVPNEGFTISARTPDGQKITFSFIRRPTGDGHQCVEIIHHTGNKTVKGYPVQQAAMYGLGPTNAICRYNDESPTTLVSVSLLKAE